jgi:hypothetical protein
MKTTKLILSGAAIATSLLLGVAGCHSTGMPQTGSNTPIDSTNNKKLDSVTNRQNPGDTARNNRSMDTARR